MATERQVSNNDSSPTIKITNYKQRVVLIAIIIAWVLLFICFMFKLFGSKVFDIAVTNQRFVNACNWLDNDGVVCKYIIAFIMYIVSTPFIVLASAMKPNLKTKWMFIILPVLCGVWVVKFFNDIAGFVVELVTLIVLPAIISKKWWSGFVGVALDLLFQVLSMFIRGQDMKIFDDYILISLIMSIDYYIMIALFYLFAIVINNKKEDK